VYDGGGAVQETTVRTRHNAYGLDASDIINSSGVNIPGIISQAYNQVTIRTAVTPDIVFPISATGAPPDAASQQLLNQLQPTVIVSGPAGSFSLAPFGQPVGQRSWLPIALVGLGAVLFVGWAVFGK
jgi:hypothetical protein